MNQNCLHPPAFILIDFHQRQHLPSLMWIIFILFTFKWVTFVLPGHIKWPLTLMHNDDVVKSDLKGNLHMWRHSSHLSIKHHVCNSHSSTKLPPPGEKLWWKTLKCQTEDVHILSQQRVAADSSVPVANRADPMQCNRVRTYYVALNRICFDHLRSNVKARLTLRPYNR